MMLGESYGTEGPGSRTVQWYLRPQRQTTKEIWLPYNFAHSLSHTVHLCHCVREIVCTEPIRCCVMIGWNPSHADRACAPLDALRSNGNPRPSDHTGEPVGGLDLYALNA